MISNKHTMSMKKHTWIYIVLIIVLAILCASFWQYGSANHNKMEVMCKSSVNAALEHFEEYSISKNEADYISGIAEFRSYMTAYLCLTNEASSAEYIWCNTLYGEMTLDPEGVKSNIQKLIDALEYLAEDYTHANGFNLIHALTNELTQANNE